MFAEGDSTPALSRSEPEIRAPARDHLLRMTGKKGHLLPLGIAPIAVRTASDIGQLVRRRRVELGLTQQEVATSARTGRRFVSELEDGKETAQIGKILHILSDLGIALSAKKS